MSTLTRRLPHRAFNSANRQRGELTIAEIRIHDDSEDTTEPQQGLASRLIQPIVFGISKLLGRVFEGEWRERRDLNPRPTA
jgi:hypothetical protein